MAHPIEALRKAATAVDFVPDESNRGSAFLMASLTAIAGIFTVLGLTGGLIGRMARNHPVFAGGALAVAGGAVVVGFIGGGLTGVKQRHALNLGIGLFLVAAVLAILAGISTWGDATTPRVTATAKRTASGEALAISVKDSGMKAKQKLVVSVWPIAGVTGPSSVDGAPLDAAVDYRTGGLPLYQSINGPNSDGEVDLSQDVPLPDDYPPSVIVQAVVEGGRPSDCFKSKSHSGCVTLSLGDAGTPQLDASWAGLDSSHPRLGLAVSAENIPRQLLYVRALVRGSPTRRGIAKRHEIARVKLTPAASGDVRHKLDLMLPAHARTVCVVASTAGNVTCPPILKASPSAAAECAKTLHQQQVSSLGTVPQRQPELLTTCRRSILLSQQHGTTWERFLVPR
ncbi:MAG TPA: hypothetical protein VLJ42_08265 [Solirubrobacteraceae bacterium]|nr:hypothetical protein [Solirubrobacteraceae bacterium]